MGALIGQLTKFITLSGRSGGMLGKLKSGFSGVFGVMSSLTAGVLGLAGVLGGALISAFGAVIGSFMSGMKHALGFELSITGLLDEAEKAREFWSTMADSMNFYSSSTGSTTNAMNMLTTATANSTAPLETLKSAFNSMVDAGADSDKFIKDMLPLMGDLETKTGLGAQQFGQFSTKFQQMFGEKKGITKDIKNLTTALVGTGLKGAQLEQTMQGITEAAEKMGFATRGDTLDIKGLAKEFGKTSAVFKAFGISAQTTSSFLNGLVDPENVEKNMLLMNKMGISYSEFNDMLNSGKGHDKFFDKILKNVGSVAQEANMIQDASTRYKYLKDTLNLPPEIANKLMKVSPARMQTELKKIKKEMEEAEKKDKWRKDLKAREEKYEEQMRFLRMQMVAPLIQIIQKNRTAIQNFMRALTPIISKIAAKLASLFGPISEWFGTFGKSIEGLTGDNDGDFWKTVRAGLSDLWKMLSDTFAKIWNDPDVKAFISGIKESIMSGLSAAWKMMMESFGEYIKEAMSAALKAVLVGFVTYIGITLVSTIGGALAVAAGAATAPIWVPIAAALAGVAAVGAGIATLWNAFSLDDAENRQKASDLTKDKEINTGLASDGKFQTMNDWQDEQIEKQKAANLKTGWTSDKNVGDLQDSLRKGDVEDSKKQLAELRAALLDNGNAAADVDKYLDGLVKETFNAKGDAKVMAASVAQTIQDNKEQSKEMTDLATKPLSDAEVAAAVQKLMANQDFIAKISSAVVGQKDQKINELTSDMDKMKKVNDDLKKEFEALKNESVPGILKQWEQFLFGDTDDSIKVILSDIRDATMGDMKLNIQNTKRSKTTGVKNTDIGDVEGKVITEGISGGTSFAGPDIGASVKNLQAKQTVYLKGIYTASLQTSKVLTYIGNNLIFTGTGLAVNQGLTKTFTLKDIKGNDQTDSSSVVSGFNVIKP